MYGDGHDLGALRPLLVQPVQAVQAARGPIGAFVVLHDHGGDVVQLHRVGHRHQRAVRGGDGAGFVVPHPVADVLHPGLRQQFRRVQRLRQPRAEPADGAGAGEGLQPVHGAMDHAALVRLLVDRALLPGMAHELPPGVPGGGGHPFVVVADARVDGERRADAQPPEHFMETPEADAHPVFVPGPVGHVRQQHLARGRRQDLPGHGLGDVPDLQVDDGPHRDARPAGQAQRRAVHDGAVGRAVPRLRHPRQAATARAAGCSAGPSIVSTQSSTSVTAMVRAPVTRVAPFLGRRRKQVADPAARIRQGSASQPACLVNGAAATRHQPRSGVPLQRRKRWTRTARPGCGTTRSFLL